MGYNCKLQWSFLFVLPTLYLSFNPAEFPLLVFSYLFHRAFVLKLDYTSQSLGRFIVTQIEDPLPVSDCISPSWGLIIFISAEFPGVNTTSLEDPTLRTVSGKASTFLCLLSCTQSCSSLTPHTFQYFFCRIY